MDLNDLHLAVVIAREGNLAAASHVLGVSQPTLSKAVARLERETRVRLFERVARGMRPTEIGQVFLERARALDLSAVDLYAAMRDLRQARAGLLKFGVGQGVPDHWIAPVVSTLADDGVRFEISGGMPDALLPRVALGELEYSLSGISAPPAKGSRGSPSRPIRSWCWRPPVTRWLWPARNPAGPSSRQRAGLSRRPTLPATMSSCEISPNAA